MQKLVYDNYNKFITATETIKEMKNDVYGMDPDMDAVRWAILLKAYSGSKCRSRKCLHLSWIFIVF